MQHKPIEPLTAAEFRRLLDVTGSGAIGVRDRAILQVLCKSQLRISELIALMRSDYDAENFTLLVKRGKGGKSRLAVLHQSAEQAIDEWITLKDKLCLPDPLFCSMKGSPLNRQNIGRKLRTLGRKAGIHKRIFPHLLRHTGARWLASAGVPVHLVSSQLGHSNLAITHHYLQSLCPRERIDRILGVTWQ